MLCQLALIKNVYRRLTEPDHCLLCLTPLRNQPLALCNGCQLDLPWLLHSCRHCALPLPADATRCSQCLADAPLFRLARCAWRYDFPVNALIGGFKYNRQWPAGQLLSSLLATHLQHLHVEEDLTLPDALIPVPLSARRLRQRGYNQALMIARWLGKPLRVPVLHNSVKRVRNTQIQQGLNARQRQANMLNAFAVTRPAQVCGRHLALVDDVLTTGATCTALTKALLAAGAARVDVYCLARAGRLDNSLSQPP